MKPTGSVEGVLASAEYVEVAVRYHDWLRVTVVRHVATDTLYADQARRASETQRS